MMLNRRGLLGFMSLAPAVIVTPGLLMPVSSKLQRLPTRIRLSDVAWTFQGDGWQFAVGGQLARPDGSVWRHAVAFSHQTVIEGPAAIDRGKVMIAQWFNTKIQLGH